MIRLPTSYLRKQKYRARCRACRARHRAQSFCISASRRDISAGSRETFAADGEMTGKACQKSGKHSQKSGRPCHFCCEHSEKHRERTSIFCRVFAKFPHLFATQPQLSAISDAARRSAYEITAFFHALFARLSLPLYQFMRGAWNFTESRLHLFAMP